MFKHLKPAPADPILGLTAAFKEDSNPDKINLGVGVYRDFEGKTPVLRAVKEAENRILANQETKDYLPIDGTAQFGHEVRKLLFEQKLASDLDNRAVTVQTPGGTGALRLAADFLHQMFPKTKVWLSEPTWANHPKIFQTAGLNIGTYPYFDATSNSLNFEDFCKTVAAIPSGDIVLVHGCCHNPTGVDPTAEQWRQLGEILARNKVIPLVDFAYQGLGVEIDTDAVGLRKLCEFCPDVLIANSFSKNFGLYQDRVGSLTVVTNTENEAQSVLTHLKTCVRTNFSNPPAHGSSVVTEVLQSVTLRKVWLQELNEMRVRIDSIRRLFVEKLKEHGVTQDFSFIKEQKGMFSFSGLSKEQVAVLRESHSIYIVDSGRINVAGITERNIDTLSSAIADVLP